MHIYKAIHPGHCGQQTHLGVKRLRHMKVKWRLYFMLIRCSHRGTKVEITWGNKMGEVTQPQLHPVGHQLQYFLRMCGEQPLSAPFGYNSYSLQAIQE